MTSLTSSLYFDQTYSFILSTMMTNRPSTHRCIWQPQQDADCGKGPERPQRAEGRPGAAVYLMSHLGFSASKKTILHPSHLLATWHSSIFWSSLENHQAIKDLQIFGPAKNWGHSLFGLNPSNQRKRTAPKSGASWHSAFPRLSRWKLSGSSRLDMLDLQAFLHHRPHEIQPLVVFEKSGFFGWNQGIQQFSSARKILRKTWTSSFTTVSSHIHTQPVLGCRPLNQPGSPGDSPS